MPLGRKVDGGSNYKCSDFEDRERILERITMNITFEPCVKVQNENRKIVMISLGIYRPNTIRNTSIDVVPPKRNIFDKTIVDIGSTHMGVPYETLMCTLSIIFFPPVRSEPLSNLLSGRISPRMSILEFGPYGWKKYYR